MGETVVGNGVFLYVYMRILEAERERECVCVSLCVCVCVCVCVCLFACRKSMCLRTVIFWWKCFVLSSFYA